MHTCSFSLFPIYPNLIVYIIKTLVKLPAIAVNAGSATGSALYFFTISSHPWSTFLSELFVMNIVLIWF